MTGGLVIRLRPHEKFLINGAVLENGEKRAKLRVKSQGVNVLRLRDAMHPSEASTPVKRLYYLAQLGVTGDASNEDILKDLLPGLKAVFEAMPDSESRDIIERARTHASASEFYQAMRALKLLIPVEEKLLLLAQVNTTSRQHGAVN